MESIVVPQAGLLCCTSGWTPLSFLRLDSFVILRNDFASSSPGLDSSAVLWDGIPCRSSGWLVSSVILQDELAYSSPGLNSSAVLWAGLSLSSSG